MTLKHWLFAQPKHYVTVIGICTCVIAMILMLYHGIRYFSHRRNVVLQKRFANITIFVVSCQMLKQLSWAILLVNNLFWENPHHILTYMIIRIPLTYIFYFSTIYGWVWRFWMSNFQLHLTKQSLKIKWQSIINDNVEQNWYINHQRTLGNQRFVYFVLILPFVVITVVLLSCLGYIAPNDQFSTIIGSVAILLTACILPLAILIYTFRSIPKLDDNFFIYEELKRLLFILIITTILWSISVIMSLFGVMKNFYAETKFDSDHYVFGTLYEMFTGMTQVAGVLISTWWVNTKIIPIINSTKYRIKTKESVEYLTVDDSAFNVNTPPSKLRYKYTKYTKSSKYSKSGQTPIDFSELLKSSVEEKYSDDEPTVTHELQQKTILYQDMVKSQVCFEEFVLYLSKDLCIENMLAFIEMLQLQKFIDKYIMRHEVETHHKLKISLYKTVQFPLSIPSSLIVYGDNNDNNIDDVPLNVFTEQCKKKVFRIYKKYVMWGKADYRIDINDDTRDVLDNWIQSKNHWEKDDQIELEDLLDIFEECVDEVFAILCDSYRRFIQTQIYKKLKNIDM